MPTHNDPENEDGRYRSSYSSRRPIPTIQKYRETKEQRKSHADDYALDEEADTEEQGVLDTAGGPPRQDGTRTESYGDRDDLPNDTNDDHSKTDEHKSGNEPPKDTSETALQGLDARHKRKEIKKRRGDRAERQVTDPVTHLPLTIHDLQSSDLKDVDENEQPPGALPKTATGLSNRSKTDDQLEEETMEMAHAHEQMVNLFPPPEFDALRDDMAKIQSFSLALGLGLMAAVFMTGFGFYTVLLSYRAGTAETHSTTWLHSTFVVCFVATIIALVVGIIWGLQTWTAHKMSTIWDNNIWETQHKNEKKHKHTNETTRWLNSLLAAVWPLVNPDLFTSLADMIEDVMQASLPSFVRMVSVDDVGQGSEAIRILGVRWLPTGAAARSVTSDGKLQPRNDKDNKSKPDSNGSSSGNQKGETEAQEQEEEQAAAGLEAEEGDFVNLEIALAYRGRKQGMKFRDRARHLHMLLHFYLPGSIKIPVFVDMRGLLVILRLRLQLTPDPPFFGLCTFTFLGQPKVDVACIPLAKKGLNIMDLPLVSNFVQSAVDAAMAEYVAPKSMTIDLKDMLAGDDFKRDTGARGIIVAHIKRGFDFTEGDPGIPLIRQGSADPYVTIGWAKLGKPVWSTRVLLSEMEPHWEETAFILVQEEPVNVGESIRVQLWDSDRMTADDDLGRIELELKDLMHNERTNGKMCDRTDGFTALKAGERMPGKLEWSVGWFPKIGIQDDQLKQQDYDTGVRTRKALEKKVETESRRKLREAMKDESREIEQQMKQGYKEVEDRMICAAPPATEYPSGILSIQIHQIVGLEMEKLNHSRDDSAAEDQEEEQETGDDLPSAYCAIILNHQQIYRTRAKPKNSNPFYNAATERYIRDWRTAEVFVMVRDFRVHEDDALLGFVHLPLAEVFQHKSQTSAFYPMEQGIGYGRVRISLVFRSVQVQAPRSLLGWEYGTLHIGGTIVAKELPKDLSGMRMKLKTSLAKHHMYPAKDKQSWAPRHDKKLALPVKKRHSSALVIQLRKDSAILDKNKTAAFSVLWLDDIIDEEDTELDLPVWKGNLQRATACHLKECGERVGTITIKLRFAPGLSHHHEMLTKRNTKMREVFEVLDAARDRNETREVEEKSGALRKVEEESDDSSDDQGGSDDDSDDDKHGSYGSKDSLQDDGERGLVSALKQYKKNAKQDHRKHRGIMQWQAPRTMKWAKHKLDNGQNKVAGLFHHHERETNVESEV